MGPGFESLKVHQTNARIWSKKRRANLALLFFAFSLRILYAPFRDSSKRWLGFASFKHITKLLFEDGIKITRVTLCNIDDDGRDVDFTEVNGDIKYPYGQNTDITKIHTFSVKIYYRIIL